MLEVRIISGEGVAGVNCAIGFENDHGAYKLHLRLTGIASPLARVERKSTLALTPGIGGLITLYCMEDAIGTVGPACSNGSLMLLMVYRLERVQLILLALHAVQLIRVSYGTGSYDEVVYEQATHLALNNAARIASGGLPK